MAAPPMARQRRDTLDVPRPQPVTSRVQEPLNHRGVRHDCSLQLDDEVHAAHRVIEVLVRERVVRIRPRRVDSARIEATSCG
jgi:hypothetical protein